MKQVFLLIIFFLVTVSSYSQKLSEANRRILEKKEDTLKRLAYRILNDNQGQPSLMADSMFTRLLVRALKTPNSFYYSFDSLSTISVLVPPDSSFRIFTWQVMINDDLTRKHGAIQMRTIDGSLKLFPLIDKSDVTDNIQDTVANNFGWMGAVYYKVIQKTAYNKNFYTFLGYDENNIRSNRKIIEVLTFKNGEPVFGGPYFSFPNGSFTTKFGNRYVMEYKKHAGPRLNYDSDEDMIMVEHLISESGEPNKKYTLVPDGDYDALKWRDGRWVYITKVYTYKLKDGEAPVPHPLNADNGTLSEKSMGEEISSDDDSPTNGDDKPASKTKKDKKKGKKDNSDKN